VETKRIRKKPSINQSHIGVNSMNEENELEQIRLNKIKAMLDTTAKGQNTSSKQPIILNDNSFSTTIANNELIVVDFWAPWCGPCRVVGPVIEELAAQYSGKVTFGKMNVDENQTAPSSFGIMSIPTIIIFNHGKEVERSVGAYPKAHIEAMIKRCLASDHRE
jgi:thioredoxin 1